MFLAQRFTFNLHGTHQMQNFLKGKKSLNKSITGFIERHLSCRACQIAKLTTPTGSNDTKHVYPSRYTDRKA